MDILSLGKANKAKRAIKKVNDRIGSGVGLSYGSAKKRIEFLESKDPKVDPSKRVSALEANTHINLNKHILRVNTLMDKKRLGLKDMIVDDLGDDSGLKLNSSTNVAYVSSSSLVEVLDKNEEGIIFLKDELLQIPAEILSVSLMHTGGDKRLISLDLSNGAIENLIYQEGELSVTQIGDEFLKEGTWISEPVILEEKDKKFLSIKTTGLSEGVEVSFSYSKNGTEWSEFIDLYEDDLVNVEEERQLIIKLKLKSIVTAQAERELISEKVELISSVNKAMAVDTSFTEIGEVSGSKLDLSKFKTIGSIGVS